MHTQLKQELYKLNHRKLPWVIIILMLFLMIVMGLAMGRTYSNLLVMTCYDSSAIIMLILVIVGSTMFSMELQHGTIIPLIYRSSSRSAVFFAKFITLFLYDLILHIAAMILTVLLNIAPIINAPVSWTAIYQYHQPLVVNMVMTAGVDMVTSTLIISLICLTSCLINSNTTVIAINALIIFMGTGLSSSLLLAHVGPSSIVRWNPFNMLNLTSQYYNYATYHITSMLSNAQLLTGTICYMIVFLLLAYWAFSRKKF
jgi:ABC-2 type transport system permease protein